MISYQTGLGKSTLINSLFLTDLYPDRVVPTAAEKIERKTLKLDASTVSQRCQMVCFLMCKKVVRRKLTSDSSHLQSPF